MSLDPQNPHHALIERQLPAWAATLAPAQWRTLHEHLTASEGALITARKALASALQGLRQPAEFAEPLLADRLRRLHGLSVPARTTELLHVHPFFTWGTYVHTHERRSLLEAALQNFPDDISFSLESVIAAASSLQVKPIKVIGQAPLGDSETLTDIELDSERYTCEPLALSPEAFAATVRELDLGQSYQAHLDEVFAPPQVALCAKALEKARLQLALERLPRPAPEAIRQLLEHGTHVASQQLALFGLTLHEAVLFDLGESGLLLYLPGVTPVLRALPDVAELNDWLCTELLEPPFRQHLMNYLPHDVQATFLDRLQQNLDGSGNAALDAQWPLRVGADLHLSFSDIPGPLFDFLHSDHLARLKAQARVVAVPTADADERARKQRRERWQSLGLDALMLAGFFVPAVGTLMTVVMAYQMLDEVYEGYEAWNVGDRHLALRHLEAVGLNLALAGGLQAAGQMLPKLFNSTLMESLDPVTLGDGRQRLWQPDLAPYRSDAQLPDTLQANTLGHYLQDGRTYLRLDGHLYQSRFDEAEQAWRLVHPQTPDAYRPGLEHNHDGAWRVAHENPQHWSLATLVRRLDPRWQVLDDAQLQQAAWISGVDFEQLRLLHLSNAPTPPLLFDTLLRLRAEAQAQTQRVLEPARQHDALFGHFYSASSTPSVNHTLLRQAFPTLTSALAERLLTLLDADELQAWQATGELPERLQKVAADTCHRLPLVRALEGLYQPGLASAASERLILRALPGLAGWSSDWRIELRASSPQGPTLAAAGSAEATDVNIIIKSSDGYEADLGERPAPAPRDHDLCRALLAVLPAARREALGLKGTDVQALRERIQAQVDAAPQRFLRALRDQPPVRWGHAGGLRGGVPDPLPRPAAMPIAVPLRTLYRRYRAVFPMASEGEIRQRLTEWARLGLDASAEIARLDEHLQVWRQRLNGWAGEQPARRRAVGELVSAWQRNTLRSVDQALSGHTLELTDLGLRNEDLATLPLQGGLEHVGVLDLSGNPRLSQLPEHLLGHLPDLRRLYLRGCRFDQLPALATPDGLERLDLDGNRITWDNQDQTRLNRMLHLDTLDLSNNPLITSPDLSQLGALRSLSLNRCALSVWPMGLERMQVPLILDMAHNQFIELPEPLALSRDAALCLRLESDALSPRVLTQIQAYYDREGVDLLVDDGDYEDLLRDADVPEWQVWDRLPLPYRRDLREILDSEAYDADPEETVAELWRRLYLIDEDPQLRERALAQPAAQLLTLRF